MISSRKIDQAIRLAIQVHEVHQKQKRKGKDIPYVTHPLAVGLLLAHAGAEADVVVAGILHDTIEDSREPHCVTQETLAAEFGDRVAALVASVSAPKGALSWTERKQKALEHVLEQGRETAFLKSADVLCNVSDILNDHAREGDAVFLRFNAPGDKKSAVIAQYGAVIDALLAKWPDNPLANDLRARGNELRQLGGKS